VVDLAMHNIDCSHLQLLVVLIRLQLAQQVEIVLVGFHLDNLEQVFYFKIIWIGRHRDAATPSKNPAAIHALSRFYRFGFALVEQRFT